MSEHLSGDDMDHQQVDLMLSDDDGKMAPVNQDDEDDENATGRRIDPTASTKKRIIRNPQPKLNGDRLRGVKGVHTIEEYFQGFKWQGKNHEATDLNKVMKRLEHWGHRLYPKYNFDDFLDKVATLGGKKDVQTFLTKYRRDMLTENLINTEENGIHDNNNDDDDEVDDRERLTADTDNDFDRLLAEQLEKTKSFETTTNKENSTSHNVSSSTAAAAALQLDEETKKRIAKNRQLALEKKLARQKAMEEAAAKSKTTELPQQEEQQPSVDLPSSQNLSDDNNHCEVEPVEKESNEMTIDAEESQVSSSTDVEPQTGINYVNEASLRKELDKSFSSGGDDDDLNISRGHLTPPPPPLVEISIDDTRNNASTSSTLNTTTGKRPLTNEELDREIDEAVFKFINKKRHSK